MPCLRRNRIAGVDNSLPVVFGRRLRRYWHRALAAAEAPTDLRLHDLRHCYGQWLADAGVSEARIQVGLRHASPSMTRRYTKQRDQGENAKTMADVMLRTA